jgi:hypothetical protein
LSSGLHIPQVFFDFMLRARASSRRTSAAPGGGAVYTEKPGPSRTKRTFSQGQRGRGGRPSKHRGRGGNKQNIAGPCSETKIGQRAHQRGEFTTPLAKQRCQRRFERIRASVKACLVRAMNATLGPANAAPAASTDTTPTPIVEPLHVFNDFSCPDSWLWVFQARLHQLWSPAAVAWVPSRSRRSG